MTSKKFWPAVLVLLSLLAVACAVLYVRSNQVDPNVTVPRGGNASNEPNEDVKTFHDELNRKR